MKFSTKKKVKKFFKISSITKKYKKKLKTKRNQVHFFWTRREIFFRNFLKAGNTWKWSKGGVMIGQKWCLDNAFVFIAHSYHIHHFNIWQIPHPWILYGAEFYFCSIQKLKFICFPESNQIYIIFVYRNLGLPKIPIFCSLAKIIFFLQIFDKNSLLDQNYQP